MPAALAEPLISLFVVLLASIVGEPVDLDDQPLRIAGKVGDEGPMGCCRRNFTPRDLPRNDHHSSPSAWVGSCRISRAKRVSSGSCRGMVRQVAPGWDKKTPPPRRAACSRRRPSQREGHNPLPSGEVPNRRQSGAREGDIPLPSGEVPSRRQRGVREGDIPLPSGEVPSRRQSGAREGDIPLPSGEVPSRRQRGRGRVTFLSPRERSRAEGEGGEGVLPPA